MDQRTWTVMTAFQEFVDEALDVVRSGKQGSGPKLHEVVAEHLGVDMSTLPVVRLDVPRHDFVNLDVALEALAAEQVGEQSGDHAGGPDGAPRVIGIAGDNRHHQTFSDMLAPQWGPSVGAVDRIRMDTGPESNREAVVCGVHLFRYRGTPVAILQRRGNMRYGNGETGIEVLAAGPVTDDLLADVRRLMLERNVFRGQVIGFQVSESDYGPSEGGVRFLPRPHLEPDQVVLPEGSLGRLERHIAGTARHRDRLLADGQHLKRGLLLFGPPGTGKTHTVRYLVGEASGVTCVLMSGRALGLIDDAVSMARALQPSVVVLEDVDLIAEQRELHLGPQPLLFNLLDAMDGLDGDSDVAFVLTTNRVDLLEEALSQRPGRVDLAVEVPRPDQAGRRKLLQLYAGRLPLSPAALDDAAARSEGVTASFFKELARRVVLLSAENGTPVDDAALAAALAEMLGDAERLTRALLGSDPGPAPDASGEAPGWPDGPPRITFVSGEETSGPNPAQFGPGPTSL